jgi:hypothetical protein
MRGFDDDDDWNPFWKFAELRAGSALAEGSASAEIITTYVNSRFTFFHLFLMKLAIR